MHNTELFSLSDNQALAGLHNSAALISACLPNLAPIKDRQALALAAAIASSGIALRILQKHLAVQQSISNSSGN